MDKKGQLKIHETAFVLLGLAVLFGIVFIFFVRFQTGGIQQAAESVKQKQTLSLLEKISAMPELRSSYYGIDEDKLKIFQPLASNALYVKQWQGLQRVSIIKIWPSAEEFQIYNKGNGNFTYSTFINICKQKFATTSAWACSLGLMEISYNI